MSRRTKNEVRRISYLVFRSRSEVFTKRATLAIRQLLADQSSLTGAESLTASDGLQPLGRRSSMGAFGHLRAFAGGGFR